MGIATMSVISKRVGMMRRTAGVHQGVGLNGRDLDNCRALCQTVTTTAYLDGNIIK